MCLSGFGMVRLYNGVMICCLTKSCVLILEGGGVQSVMERVAQFEKLFRQSVLYLHPAPIPRTWK